ncbi:hypothetical protein Y033_2045 [Burkholderia pseudomallei MSHR435]|nr:hypothetical protein Y034_1637 [Burkholderia pseudomallei MSHR449]KGX76379.1 hypothetical protein Y033_2045 [Burkholderia pseudomallei MSHR435]
MWLESGTSLPVLQIRQRSYTTSVFSVGRLSISLMHWQVMRCCGLKHRANSMCDGLELCLLLYELRHDFGLLLHGFTLLLDFTRH